MKSCSPGVVMMPLSSKLIKGTQLIEAPTYFLNVRDLSSEMGEPGLFSDKEPSESLNSTEFEERVRLKVEEIAQESRYSGYEEGYREGLEKANQVAASIRADARSVLDQAKSIHREKITSLEGDIVSLAVEIAEKVLAVKLDLDRDVVLNIASEAISTFLNREHYIIYVNPSEAEIFRAGKIVLEKLVSEKATIQVVLDSAVNPGGCLVETEQGIIDASLDARWSAVLKAVYNGEG